jgi:hypothetical protein
VVLCPWAQNQGAGMPWGRSDPSLPRPVQIRLRGCNLQLCSGARGAGCLTSSESGVMTSNSWDPREGRRQLEKVWTAPPRPLPLLLPQGHSPWDSDGFGSNLPVQPAWTQPRLLGFYWSPSKTLAIICLITDGYLGHRKSHPNSKIKTGWVHTVILATREALIERLWFNPSPGNSYQYPIWKTN